MRSQQKIINLFNDKHIASIKHVFSIAGEDDLDQTWNYFDQKDEMNTDDLNSFISLFYQYSNKQISTHPQTFFELILEISKEYCYFTIWNETVANSFAQFIDSTSLEYLLNSKRITIRIKKNIPTESIPQENTAKKDQQIISSVLDEKSATKLIPVYTFINPDDLEELLSLCDDMQDLIASANKHGFVNELFIRFRSCFSMFTLELRHYQELNSITHTITAFSALINSNQEQFSALSAPEILMIEGFISNIDTWLRTLFIKGGAELTFMDRSLQADFETISMLLTPQSDECSIEEEDLDDIFDF